MKARLQFPHLGHRLLAWRQIAAKQLL